MDTLRDLLTANRVLTLFMILGLGSLLGRVRIFGVEVGNVAGVLFVGLIAGYLGYRLPTDTLNVGFILFIYCVGYQAGPQFMGAFRADGPRYLVLAATTASVATVLAYAFGQLLSYAPGVASGLLAGALTSTTTLVAAQDAAREGAANSGLSVIQVMENISSAYAICFVFGLVGLILFINLIPRLFKIDVAEEAQEYSARTTSGRSVDAYQMHLIPATPRVRAYRVENPEILERSAEDMDWTISIQVQRVKRGEEVSAPDADYEFELGDIVSLVGLPNAHEVARKKIGPEVIDHDVLDRSTESRNVLIVNKHVAGKTLEELNLVRRFDCHLTVLKRAGEQLPRRPDLVVQLGDELLVTGPSTRLDELTEAIGVSQESLLETDIIVLFLGIAVGVFIGSFSIHPGGLNVSLGAAGGTLVAGIVFGLVHSRRPTLGRFPAAARKVVMELGMLLFMAQVAVYAGTDIVTTMSTIGPSLALAGIVVTIVPVIFSFVVGRYLMHMNGALLLGALAGSMTNAASLGQVNKQTRSSVPMLGYVGTYAIASVLLTIAGALIIRL